MARAERWIRTKGGKELNLPIGCLPRRSLREIPGNDYLQHHIDITTMRAEFKRDCKPRPRPTEGQGFFLIQATVIGCIFLHFRVAKTYHLNVGLGTAKPAEQRAGLLSQSHRGLSLPPTARLAQRRRKAATTLVNLGTRVYYCAPPWKPLLPVQWRLCRGGKPLHGIVGAGAP